MVGEDKVKATNSAKLLGIHIGADLTWKTHTEKLKVKLRNSSGLLRRLAFKMPRRSLKPIAEATFNSHLRYGIAIYNQPKINKEGQENKLDQLAEELQVLQNKMFRTILGYKMSDKISRKNTRRDRNDISKSNYLFPPTNRPE